MHTVTVGVVKNPVVKAKDLPKGRLGKIDDRLHVFKSNDDTLIRVWIGLQDEYVNVEPLADKNHRAYSEWNVEVLPEGSMLTLTF